MSETVRNIETGMRVHGRGNELTVRGLVSLDGVEPDERTVVKEPNRCFFGWQTPRYEDMSGYIEALQEYGFRLRESLRIIELKEGYEVKRVMDCTRMELIENFWKQLTVGAVLKLLTKQFGGDVPNFVITEEYSGKPCMVMDDMGDATWGPLLCEILANGEKMYANTRLMVDPLGGAAISSALRCLFNPASSPILSNLEKGPDGQIILTDPGPMNAGEGERVSNIPGTRWLMALSLRLLGEFGFEAMNMALRDYGNNIEPRPLGVSNAVPKAAAFLGYRCVKLVREFWRSRIGEVMCGVSQGVECLA
jgi:hypothetical protein